MVVVDDNEHMVEIISLVLRAFKVRNIRFATDGVDALSMMRASKPDIVICDLDMRPLSGAEFTRIVRTAPDSPDPFVPIIMLTGYTEQSFVTEGRDSGITEFLAKPVSSRDLYRRILEVVENPRPFVKCRSYTGPNRRRRDMPIKHAERRINASIQERLLSA